MFITIEGPEGSGKTTAVNAAVEQLEKMGYQIVRTREPIPVLITCNHIIDKDFLLENEILYISINKKTFKLSLDKIKYYTNKIEDITILEIKKDESNNENIINDFLELNYELLNNSIKKVQPTSLYIIHYPDSSPYEAVVSYGILIRKNEYHFEHNCSTQIGSSGSPLLDITNNRVIGIHTGTNKYSNCNSGIFLKGSINNFINENYTNEMIINYKINGDKDIPIFGARFIEKNRNNYLISVDNKEQEISETINVENMILKNNILTIKLISKKMVTDMSNMFYGCEKLYSISNISKWNIDKVTNMSYMFYGCSELSFLPDISRWNTQNVKEMNNMFHYCSKLSSLPDLSKWNTQNVINMDHMFNY